MPSPPPTSPVDGPSSTPTRSPLAKRLYRGIGFATLGLAVAGIVLPGLPATPFLLVAAWAFRRGNPELAARLEAHPRFGPTLRDWRERRAVPARAKVAAVLSMAASFALLAWTGAPGWTLALVGAILAAVSFYLVTRPSA